MKTKILLKAAGLLVLGVGTILGWKYILKPPSSPPHSSSSATLNSEKKESNSFSLPVFRDLGDPLLAKIINGVGEGRDIPLTWGDQDLSEVIGPSGLLSLPNGASGPAAGTNPIGFSVPTGAAPSGLPPTSNLPSSNAPQGAQVVDVFPINNSAKGEGGAGPGEGGEAGPVNSIPITVDEGDEVTINFHPHSGEDNPGEDHGNKKEETVVVTLDGDQVSVKHSEAFKVSNGNGSDNETKENHGNQDNPGHSKQDQSPIEIQVSSDDKGVHVHVPKGAHQDFDVDVGVHGKNNDSSTSLDADNSSVTLNHSHND